MNVFVLHPNVYTRSTDQGILLYDTYTELKLYFTGYDFKLISKIITGSIPVNDDNNHLLSKLYDNDLGYFIQSNQTPIIINSVNFTSSKAKISESSKILDGGNSVSYIEKISIFIDPINDNNTDKKIFDSLEFPTLSINDDELDAYTSLLKSETFPNLKEIEIVSALTDRAINLASELLELDYLVTFKTILTEIDQINYPDIEKYNEILFKVFAKANLIPFFSDLKNKNIITTFWSDKLEEILNHPSQKIIPILYDINLQKQLYNEVLLNLEDILSIQKSNYELKYNSLFNSTFMGKIKLSGKDVLIGNQVICTISDFSAGFSRSLFDTENLWFYSRNKKSSCHGCLFADLCPSVSLIEVLNIIDKPCSLISLI